jgi:ribosomal protein L18E
MSKTVKKHDSAPEDLKALLLADRQARETRAIQKIQDILAQERCVMVPVVVLAGNNVSSRIDIVAKDE